VKPLLVALALLAALAGGTRGFAAPSGASIQDCAWAGVAPEVLPEPAWTVGLTNTIRWEAAGPNCWNWGKGVDGKASKGRRYAVFVTDLDSGERVRLGIEGEHATSLTVAPEQFPGGGARDGRRYAYEVQRLARTCVSSDKVTNICGAYSTHSSPLSTPRVSGQDAQRPQAAVELEGGAQFTNRLTATLHVSAVDPPGPGRASGPGFVELSSDGTFACGVAFVCASAWAPQLQTTLAPGPDGPRTVWARVYDAARGATGLPGSIVLGRPPGNVAPLASDSIVLDTHAPAVSLRVSANPAMVGQSISFDATATRDAAGFGADSGLDAATALWRLGDGTARSGLAVSHAYRAPGLYAGEFVVRDRAGNEARATFPLTVLASGTPGGSTTTTSPPAQAPDTADRVAPSLTRAGLRRRGVTAAVVFRLSEQAAVTVQVRRIRPRPVRLLGRLQRPAAAGANRLVLTRSLARALGRRGTYELVLVARDGAGNSSAPRRVRVVRR
jgi:hypothetical protein